MRVLISILLLYSMSLHGQDTTLLVNGSKLVVKDGKFMTYIQGEGDEDPPVPTTGVRTMGEDLEFYIPDNAENGDYAGEFRIYPEYEYTGSTPTLTETGGTGASIFNISSTGIITVSDASSLSAGDYTLTIQIAKSGHENTNVTATIHCVSASVCKFIDPSAGTNGTGTRSSPYNNYSFSMTNGTEGNLRYYLIKRGTTYTSPVNFSNDNREYVVIDAYGQGDRPRFYWGGTPTRILNFSGWNDCKLRNFTVEAPVGGDVPGTGSHLLYLGGGDNTSFESGDTDVYNVKTKGGEFGIRILGFNIDGITFNFCEVDSCGHDGVFVQRNDNSYIRNLTFNGCYVHRVNLYWEPPMLTQTIAAGDGFQLEPVDNWHVKNCMIDRSDSGNKFCMIAKRAKGQCIVEYNYFITPGASNDLSPEENGVALYFAGIPDLIIRYNRITGRRNGIHYREDQDASQFYSTGATVYGNIYDNEGFKNDYSIGGSANSYLKVYNNTFINGRWIHYTYSSGARTTEYKNNIWYDVDDDADEYSSTRTMDYNLYNGSAFYRDNGVNTIENSDPLFIDGANGNYRLDIGSPAEDEGVSITGYTHDFDGTEVVNPPNIGAFE